ncbi:ThiF family adenylyltransferase [Mesorhizobium sp. M0895]|uniref:ThiF family adenylyltransferase n=1 Tax=Mesorhizobium sp. M0895 TaxID=2957019 RepID=UPI003335A180
MKHSYDLVISGRDHQRLVTHLLGDGNEAAAILLCRGLAPVRQKLMVQSVRLVPYEECRSRQPDWITWPGKHVSAAIDMAEDDGMAIILIHSHPGGFPFFSEQDDQSDREIIPGIFAGWSGPVPLSGHGSAIMTPPGAIRGRLYSSDGTAHPIGRIFVAGDDIQVFDHADPERPAPMPFGTEMTSALSELHACIVGVSGTGSVMAEQAGRMGFGAVTLIDFDLIEHKNLNRILGSSLEDAERGAIKVEVAAKAARRHRREIEINPVAKTIFDRSAVLAAAKADVIFCCVDSAEGRQICDLIAQAFMIPLIDMGVTIPTRKVRGGGRVAVADVLGRIDYVQPGGATLADRLVFTSASLRSEYLARVDPEAYANEVNEGYIRGAPQEAPSVLALNMRAASAAMLEFIARMFPYRHEANGSFARTVFALGEGEEEHFSEASFERSGARLATGLVEPLLGIPDLGA